MNYKIQLVGTNKTLIVHHNRLKLCYGSPPLKRSLKPDGAKLIKQRQSMQPSPPNRETLSNRTFAKVVATPPVIQPAGYTSTDNIGQTPRPQRNRRPPDRYTVHNVLIILKTGEEQCNM